MDTAAGRYGASLRLTEDGAAQPGSQPLAASAGIAALGPAVPIAPPGAAGGAQPPRQGGGPGLTHRRLAKPLPGEPEFCSG